MGVCACVCVWERETHTHLCEACRELWSFGWACMMDIWKLNWLSAPPSQQPAGRPLAELRESCACVCVCAVGVVGFCGGGLYIWPAALPQTKTPAGHLRAFTFQIHTANEIKLILFTQANCCVWDHKEASRLAPIATPLSTVTQSCVIQPLILPV